jgi:hypothetical protein
MAKMIRFNGAVYREAAKTVMYHGTASGPNDTILKKILKEGLNPQPKKRVFDLTAEELSKTHGIDWDARDMETYGGVYFTDSIGTAYGYAGSAMRALGGDSIMIAAQVETRSPTTRIDEDFLLGGDDFYLREYLETVQGAGSAATQNTSTILERLWRNEFDWNIIAGYYIADNIRARWKVPKQRIQQVKPLLARALMLQAQYWLAKKVQGGFVGDKSKWISVYQGDLAPMALRKQYRAAAEQVLQKLREATEPVLNGEENRIRVVEPVGYGGANRILVVVKIHRVPDTEARSPDYDAIADVLYCRDDFAMVKIRELVVRMMGRHQLWTQQGKVLYDLPRQRSREAKQQVGK